MPTKNPAETRFVELMAELFQLDEAEALDFGLYRIIRRHNQEVRAFLGEVSTDKDGKTLKGGRLSALMDEAFAIAGDEAKAEDQWRIQSLEEQLSIKPGMTAAERAAQLGTLEKITATAQLVREYRSRIEQKTGAASVRSDYVEVYARNITSAKAEERMFREPKPGAADLMGLMESMNTTYPSVISIEQNISEFFKKHREQIRSELEESGIEYNKNLDAWNNLYNYKYAEYRDSNGRYVPEHQAKATQANIWIWMTDPASMPQVKADSQRDEFRDATSPLYRFYQPIHPDSGLMIIGSLGVSGTMKALILHELKNFSMKWKQMSPNQLSLIIPLASQS